MSTVFNKENKLHEGGYAPLFLGEQLGVIDTINVTHPIFDELYTTQEAQKWNEFEVNLTQDRQDMLNMPKNTVDMMVKTIMWQHLADSVASRSIIECLGEHITNSEFHDYATIWSFYETIHGRTYSHIIKQTFTDPREALVQLYEDTKVLQRSKVLVDTFDGLKNLPKDASDDDKAKAIIKVMVALFGLEAIAFMGSFAITFGIGETGKFQGIVQLVKLICRDEVLHSRGGYHIMQILQKEMKQYFDDIEFKQELKAILDEVVNQEFQWADYIFEQGQVVGLSADLVKEYVEYMAAPVYKACGLEFGLVPEKNPLPYMDKYIDSKKVQAAAQEIELTAYKVGAIVDDTEDLSFD